MQIKEEIWNYTNLRAKIILCLKKQGENTSMPSPVICTFYTFRFIPVLPGAKTSSKSVIPALTNKLYKLTNFLISAG